MLLSIIIPCYNEASTIGMVLDRIRAVDVGALEKEIIVVDGQSTDGSKDVLAGYASIRGLRVIHEAQREGKGAAIRKGLAASTGDVVLIQDADLELDPKDWVRLLDPILTGHARAVFGSRLLSGRNPFPTHTFLFNRFMASLHNWLYPGAGLTDVLTGYKVLTASVVRELTLACRSFDIEVEITGQLLRRQIPIVEVPVSYRPRHHDEGKKIHWYDGVIVLRETFRQRAGGRLAALRPQHDDHAPVIVSKG